MAVMERTVERNPTLSHYRLPQSHDDGLVGVLVDGVVLLVDEHAAVADERRVCRGQVQPCRRRAHAVVVSTGLCAVGCTACAS